MKKISFLVLFAILLISSYAFAESNDKKEIEETIIDSYIHGLIDGENYDKAKEGIHEDFVILGHRDTSLLKKTRDQWIEQRKKRKNLPNVGYEIIFIDIEGAAASAKIKMTRSNIIAINYVFLYKFNGKWRIVSAIDDVKSIK